MWVDRNFLHVCYPPLCTVCRIVRVIRQPRGNMLLVGVGGSGRQSLSRLAAYILEYSVFQIEVTRHYRLQEFREDLRKLYFQAGVENKPSVFLFTDTQVVEESFLEDINNIFSSGEVPNLYKPDEFEEVNTSTLSYMWSQATCTSWQLVYNDVLV